MFSFGSVTRNNTSLFGQSTPVNQNRTGNSFLLDNTTAISPSIPFASSSLFGTTTSLETTTFQKYESIAGLDKNNKNDVQISSQTKLSNEFRPEEQKISSSSSPVTTTTITTLSSFLFDHKPITTTAMIFSFDNSQPALTNSSSFFPTTTTTNASFNFSSSKSAIASTSTTPPTTTVRSLFPTMDQPTRSSIELKLFQTMLNTQPFNNELTFLARNIKPNVSLNRARLRPESDLSTARPKKNPFLSVLTKPSVLSATTHSNTFSSSKSNKRKLTDSFLDDDGPSSTNTISQINIKRPRMLDMNKIRSIVLGTNEPINETSDNHLRWKKFPTYDEYISSKRQDHRLFRLPKLTHKDYYIKPTIEELRSYFNEQGQCFVKQFIVGRKHYGSVTFQGLHMNLAGLDLDRLVEIDRRQVTVYPNDEDRPVEGEELNCQAIISLFGVYPIDRSISNGGEEVTDCNRLIEMNYGKYLEEMTKKFHGQFIDYDVYTGTWTFQVEHF